MLIILSLVGALNTDKERCTGMILNQVINISGLFLSIVAPPSRQGSYSPQHTSSNNSRQENLYTNAR
jgi:hypothetical protein